VKIKKKEDTKMEESRNEAEKRMAEEVEKRVTEGFTVGIQILISVAIAFVISVVVFKYVWAWVVPDLFPGAVAQGMISSDLTWYVALKLAVLVAILSGFYPSIREEIRKKTK
jgi:mannose/fructose/N-acetylgalactosamine-specific phosphotransferase system component IIC